MIRVGSTVVSHVPRCGGTAIVANLERRVRIAWRYGGHPSLSEARGRGGFDGVDRTIAFVRQPFHWYRSVWIRYRTREGKYPEPNLKRFRTWWATDARPWMSVACHETRDGFDQFLQRLVREWPGFASDVMGRLTEGVDLVAPMSAIESTLSRSFGVGKGWMVKRKKPSFAKGLGQLLDVPRERVSEVMSFETFKIEAA